MTTYYEKLKSPKWQKKRLEILNDRGFVCESCCDDSQQLHVHHKIYKKGLSPWDYPSYNYAVLCESCHKQAHETIETLNELMGVLPIDGHFSQHGVLSFLLRFLSNEDEWILATDDQYRHFYQLSCNEDENGALLMSNLGVLSNTLFPMDKRKREFNSNLDIGDLSNNQLSEIFTVIAMNHSNIHPDQINEVRFLLGSEGI